MTDFLLFKLPIWYYEKKFILLSICLFKNWLNVRAQIHVLGCKPTALPSVLQWKPLNVITVNLISCLLYTDFVDPIKTKSMRYYIKTTGYCYNSVNVYQFPSVTKW